VKEQIENTRRQLGELGAMAHQTEQAERDILARAEKRLVEVEAELSDGEARRRGLAGDEAAQHKYLHLIEERGRLHQVIASARHVLGEAA